ncbi:MAG: hypothetical protein KC445_07070 [Anaerolineales bacterium]|nr:hypothetical protein [Anaerolineales bacterium]
MEKKAIYETRYPEMPNEVANGRLEDMAAWMLATWTGCTVDEAVGLLALGKRLGLLRSREVELLVQLAVDGLDVVATEFVEIELANIERDMGEYGRLLAQVQE